MIERHPLGEIVRLWRYPVKSLAAEEMLDVRVLEEGLDGDRHAALFVATDGHARSGRTYRGKEHRLLHTVASVEQAEMLAAQHDLTVELRTDGPHFDAGPVSILTDSWVAELEVLVGERLDPLRFRPNLFVRADPAFAPSEKDLVGRTLEAGGVAFEVVAAIERCVTTTYDIATGAADPRVLRAIAQQRANVMGIYCEVRRPGTLARGQDLWITA